MAYDWARIGKTSSVLIAITLRSVVERYTALFSQAGVKAGVASRSRLPLFIRRCVCSPLRRRMGSWRWSRPKTVWKCMAKAPRARSFRPAWISPPIAFARWRSPNFRLPPETEAALLRDQLPQPVAQPESYDPSRACLSYAAALAGASPLRPLSLNLLPREQRQSASRLRYVPTAVLGIALSCCCWSRCWRIPAIPTVTISDWCKRRSGSSIRWRKRRPRWSVKPLTRAIAPKRSTISGNKPAQDLDALNELTHLLAPPAWLNSLQLTRTSVNITGQTDQAAALIKLLDGSRQFQGSSFSLPLQKSAGGELFSIRSTRKGVAP